VLGNGVRAGIGRVAGAARQNLLQQISDKLAAEAEQDWTQVYRTLAEAWAISEEEAKELVEEMDDRLLEAQVSTSALLDTVEHSEGRSPRGGQNADLLAFLHDRLKVHLREQGIRHDVIDACLAMPGNDDLTLLVRRAEALAAFLKTDDGENLVQGFRRANNILTQAEERDGVEYSYGPDPKLAETPEETALFAALDRAEAAIAPAMKAEDFGAAMGAMAGLRAPIDAFFEAVQINTDNAIIRRNRLNLLHRIRATCAQVADLARLEG